MSLRWYHADSAWGTAAVCRHLACLPCGITALPTAPGGDTCVVGVLQARGSRAFLKWVVLNHSCIRATSLTVPHLHPRSLRYRRYSKKYADGKKEIEAEVAELKKHCCAIRVLAHTQVRARSLVRSHMWPAVRCAAAGCGVGSTGRGVRCLASRMPRHAQVKVKSGAYARIVPLRNNV